MDGEWHHEWQCDVRNDCTERQHRCRELYGAIDRAQPRDIRRMRYTASATTKSAGVCKRDDTAGTYKRWRW